MRRRLRRIAITTAVLTVAAAVGGGALAVARGLARWDRLGLGEIEVRGNVRLTSAEVVRTTALEPGRNLLTIDPERTTRRLERHPWIRSAEVSRRPPRGLVVAIEEQAVSALLLATELFAVDPDGNLFKRVEPDDAIDLPVLTGFEQADLLEAPDVARRRVREALAVLAELEGAWRGATIDELHRGPLGRWSIVTDDGVEVALGPRDELDAALERYRRVRTAVDTTGRRLLRIDVSDPRDAYLRFAPASPAPVLPQGRVARAGAATTTDTHVRHAGLSPRLGGIDRDTHRRRLGFGERETRGRRRDGGATSRDAAIPQG